MIFLNLLFILLQIITKIFQKALSYKQLFYLQLFSLKINYNINYDISHLFILLLLI